MSAQWLSNSSEMSGRVSDTLAGALHGLGQPARARRLRQLLLALCVLWAVLAVARLIWAFLPTPAAPEGNPADIINPVATTDTAPAKDTIDIERMRAWHLFGEAGVAPEPAPVEPEPVATARDGIEKGARETGLKLKLRGIVASTEDGLGHAIIEHKSRQKVYAVDDKLPVAGRVVLAKVMPGQVVLDNGGTYELLVLYDDTRLDGQLSAPAASRSSTRQVDKRSDEATSALARSYRERLYKDPQSLAQVVSVSAVREGGQLLGYRVAPGKDSEQFKQLGFKPGDLVTSINGIALDDPANTMRLYQAMRSASEAEFDVQRDDQQLSISVSLDSGATQ